jgi:hypothetical protein
MRHAAIAAGLGLALAIPAIATAQGASQAPPVSVRVLVVNDAGVDADVLDAAERDAAAIYRKAGVGAIWLNGAEADAADHPLNVTVVLLSRANTSAIVIRAGLTPDVLGFAPMDRSGDHGRLAYVFPGRIEDYADGHDLRLSRLLGQVIAHEVGHLLLGMGSHSDRGLMRGTWDVGLAALAYFTNVQAVTIRQYLVSSAPREAAGK